MFQYRQALVRMRHVWGQDEAEKLDYVPGIFSVERHVRGKWACRHCERLKQAPVPARVIDKGIPAAGLLVHVPVAKFLDRLHLYRQEHIFGRAGMVDNGYDSESPDASWPYSTAG